MIWTWFHRLGSPPYVYRLAGRLTPWFAWSAGLLMLAGLFGGLVLAPPDYQQGGWFPHPSMSTRRPRGCR
ncbi:MAG: hypothetical protein WDM77_21875 [Steroidobacteraceae bacterium]